MIRCMNCMEEYEEEFELCPYCGFVKGTPPKEVYHLHPGMLLLDRYEIGVVVNYGGFGIVYKAWDRTLDTMVAIKEYYPTMLVNRVPGQMQVEVYQKKQIREYQHGLEQFLDEARNTSKFSQHPNIVHIYNYFEENGTAYMVMEYMNGLNLKQYLIQRGGRLDVDETVKILLSVIEALKALHGKGILHRDISPDNIFVLADGTVKLFDLGAARFSNEEEAKTRDIVLKPGYAPPEQYQSKSKQGPWTDIYALGATMYHVITGVVPDESVNRNVEDKLKTPKEVVEDIPDYIDVSLMVAMSLTPELRFQNVQQFENAILNKVKVNTIEEDLKRRKRKRTAGLVIAGLVIAAGGIYAVATYHNKRMEVELAPATVSMWVEVGNEYSRTQEGINADASESQKTVNMEAAIEQEQKRIEDALEAFRDEYPHIQLDITYIPEDEYEEKLEQALADHSMPVLFESTKASNEILEQSRDISDVLKRHFSMEEYYFLKDYDTYFPDGTQIPLGFLTPYQYTNFTIQGNEGVEAQGSLSDFLNQTCSTYIGNSDSYYQISNQLAGEYQVQGYADYESICFCDTWSVSRQAKREEAKAAERVIYYLLSEWGQDVYYIQAPGGLPLNKNELKVYMEVNPELNFLEDIVQENTVNKETPLSNSYGQLEQ